MVDYQLYYGLVISFNELRELGFITSETLGISGDEIQEYIDEDLSDFYYQVKLEIEYLSFQPLPHDFMKVKGEFYYMLGLTIPGIASLQDMQNAYYEFSQLIPTSLKHIEPKFYNIPDGCHCCT
jgi:hypothetical protein